MLGRCQQFCNVFDHENASLTARHDVHVRLPQLPPFIALPLLIEQTKALARGTANNHVRNGDLSTVFKPTIDICANRVIAEVRVKCFRGCSVMVDGPNALKRATKTRVDKPKGHSARTRKQVDQTIAHWPPDSRSGF
jgi:hypothetical protein